MITLYYVHFFAVVKKIRSTEGGNSKNVSFSAKKRDFPISTLAIFPALLDSVPNQFFKGSRARGKREKICATFARGDRLHARLFNASNTFMREYRLAARGPRLFKRVNRPLGARVAVGARRGEKIKKKKEEKKKLDFRARTRRRLTGQYRERFPAIYFHRQLQNIFAIYATSGSVIYRDIYIYTVARYERNDGATSMKYF